MYPAHDASRIQNFFNTPCMQAGLTNTDHHWWLSRSSVTSTSRQCRQYTYINCRHVYSSVNEFTRISRGHWIHKTWSLNMHHPQAVRPATENSNWLSLACKLQHYNNWVSTAILYIDLSYDNNNDLFTIADFNQFAMHDWASICVQSAHAHYLAFSPATNENWLSSPIPWRRLHDWINYSVRRVYTNARLSGTMRYAHISIIIIIVQYQSSLLTDYSQWTDYWLSQWGGPVTVHIGMLLWSVRLFPS